MTKSEYFTNLWETHLEWKLLVPHLAWMRFLITCNSFPLKVMVIDFWFIYKEPCRRLRSASIIPPFFALVLIPISHSLEGLRENKLSHAPLLRSGPGSSHHWPTGFWPRLKNGIQNWDAIPSMTMFQFKIYNIYNIDQKKSNLSINLALSLKWSLIELTFCCCERRLVTS